MSKRKPDTERGVVAPAVIHPADDLAIRDAVRAFPHVSRSAILRACVERALPSVLKDLRAGALRVKLAMLAMLAVLGLARPAEAAELSSLGNLSSLHKRRWRGSLARWAAARMPRLTGWLARRLYFRSPCDSWRRIVRIVTAERMAARWRAPLLLLSGAGLGMALGAAGQAHAWGLGVCWAVWLAAEAAIAVRWGDHRDRERAGLIEDGCVAWDAAQRAGAAAMAEGDRAMQFAQAYAVLQAQQAAERAAAVRVVAQAEAERNAARRSAEHWRRVCTEDLGMAERADWRRVCTEDLGMAERADPADQPDPDEWRPIGPDTWAEPKGGAR